MDRKTLLRENVEFAGTNGVAIINYKVHFKPAFRDELTGRVEMARFRNGDSAPMHLICGLPDDWATERDESGSICRVKSSIIAGFVKEGIFYTRTEAAALRVG